MSKELALAAKTRGNDAFTKGDFQTAVKEFTEAIAQDPTDAVFYSNRSGAYASLKDFEHALEDANKCVELKPSFIKGYSRQGVAHFGLNKLADAKQAYENGLKIEPTNASLKDGLNDVESKLKSRESSNPLGSLFGPDMWVKLNADPTTREYMKDPSFVSKLQMMQSNPNAFTQMASDPRMSAALGVILGVGAQGFQGAGPGAAPRNAAPRASSNGSASVEDDDDMADSDDDDAAASGTVKDEKKRSFKYVGDMTPEEAAAAREATFKKAPEPAKELSEEEKKELEEKQAAAKAKADADRLKVKVRADADKEKNAGNDFYKKRDFETAISHYNKAIEIDPSNPVYYTNLAAVHMEKKEYQSAIDICLKGVEKGRESLASYVDIAKALARIGAAYHALDNLDQAVEYYSKSLVEDYNDKTKIALKKVEEEKKKREVAAYIDPAKSEEAKARGNELYNAGKFIEAIPEYSEAIKRDPKNYKVYANRAACYIKLMDWSRGLADCEECLKQDPKFIKAYIRKGKIQHFLKQYHKALATYDQALEIEPGNQEVLEGKRATMISIQSSEGDPERAKQAMADPEIQAILRDPTISKVLQDMQTNPQSGQAAMRDPTIRKSIEKLIAAGVLAVK